MNKEYIDGLIETVKIVIDYFDNHNIIYWIDEKCKNNSIITDDGNSIFGMLEPEFDKLFNLYDDFEKETKCVLQYSGSENLLQIFNPEFHFMKDSNKITASIDLNLYKKEDGNVVLWSE